jgi:hypothetical protein
MARAGSEIYHLAGGHGLVSVTRPASFVWKNYMSMPHIAIALISLAAIGKLVFGVRYLLAREFMTYHRFVARISWPQIDTPLQTLILGLLRMIGGAFLTEGLALIWLVLPLSRGEQWAAWAILSVAAVSAGPALYVTLSLRRFEPRAKTPVVPTALGLAAVIIAVLLAQFR